MLTGTGRGAVRMDVHLLKNHTAVSLADTRKLMFSGKRNRVLFFVYWYDLVKSPELQI